MSIPTIPIEYLSNNRFFVRLYDCDKLINLTSITKVSLNFYNGNALSSEDYPYSFDWRSTPKGFVMVRLDWKDLNVQAGSYNANFVIYDDLNYLGILFGVLRFKVFPL